MNHTRSEQRFGGVHNPITATIPPEAWEQTGPEENPATRLLCTLRINDYPFHVEAYEVTGCGAGDQEGEQDIADSYFGDEWRGICLLNQDSAYQTMDIGGRFYVVVMTPFGN